MMSYYHEVVKVLQQSATTDSAVIEVLLKQLPVDELSMLACLGGVLKDPTLERILFITQATSK